MNKSDVYDLVIVGSGFSAFGAALEAVLNGRQVLVVDGSPGAGGLASGFTYQDEWSVDKFYHHWFLEDLDVFKLLGELGLAGNIMEVPVKTGILSEDGIWRLDSIKSLLLFKQLSFLSRLRLGFLIMVCKCPINPAMFHKFTAKKFVLMLAGKEVYEKIWAPLLRSKFEKYADNVSASWIISKIYLRSKNASRHGEMLRYYEGGFQKCSQDIVRELSRLGVIFTFNFFVSNITKNTNVFELLSDEGKMAKGRKIVISGRKSTLNLMSDFMSDEALLDYENRFSMANVCVVLSLKCPLSDYYWLSMCSKNSDWVAVIEHTNMISPKLYGGRHIIYLSRYVDSSNAFFMLSDEELVQKSIEHIKAYFPDWSDEAVDVERTKVFRAKDTQPVVLSDDKFIKFKDVFDDWGVIAMEQIFPEDRGTNYAVREGRRVVRDLFA
ncbi:FAD-dependent oxidoreductase [Alphaproteobacteria bacterium]|nr:FAD-dependent oxidoreductase [Alphaproteobacteria bacterium]